MNGMAMITNAQDGQFKSNLNGRQFGNEHEDHVITYEILSSIEK